MSEPLDAYESIQCDLRRRGKRLLAEAKAIRDEPNPSQLSFTAIGELSISVPSHHRRNDLLEAIRTLWEGVNDYLVGWQKAAEGKVET